MSELELGGARRGCRPQCETGFAVQGAERVDLGHRQYVVVASQSPLVERVDLSGVEADTCAEQAVLVGGQVDAELVRTDVWEVANTGCRMRRGVVARTWRN